MRHVMALLQTIFIPAAFVLPCLLIAHSTNGSGNDFGVACGAFWIMQTVLTCLVWDVVKHDLPYQSDEKDGG